MKFIKKILVLLTAAAVGMALVACNRGDSNVSPEQNGVALALNDGTTYSNELGAVKVTWNNNSDQEILIDRDFEVQKQNGKDWVNFEPKEKTNTADEGISVKAGESYIMTYDLSSYDFTESGEYRLNVKYSQMTDADGGHYNGYTAWARFTVE